MRILFAEAPKDGCLVGAIVDTDVALVDVVHHVPVEQEIIDDRSGRSRVRDRILLIKSHQQLRRGINKVRRNKVVCEWGAVNRIVKLILGYTADSRSIEGAAVGSAKSGQVASQTR